MVKKISKIIGVQSKIGQNSKTKSNVTLEVTDEQIIDLQQFYLSIRAGHEPSGTLKRVELNLIYEEDMEEIEKTEDLERKIEELTAQLSAEIDIDITPENKDPIIDKDEAFPGCDLCFKRPEGKELCDIHCIHNSLTPLAVLSQFSVIPKSQRL